MKIAILIIGFLRTIKFNYSKLKELLSNYDCDYYLHISTTITKDKYLNEELDIQSILDLINPIKCIIEPEQSFINCKYINQKQMWYKIYILNNLKKIHETIYNFKYDVVIKYRPDLYLINDEIIFENYDFNNNTIYGSNNYSDEFNFGNSFSMDIYANLFLNFEKYIKLDIDSPFDILKHHIIKHNILYINSNIKYRLLLSLCNIIGITGDSGSGKTSLMNYLKFLFMNDVLTLECDRYHKWERNDSNWDKYTHLNPNANLLSKLHNDIFNLKIGNDIYQVDYDHSTGKFTQEEKLDFKNNIILCGLHTLYSNNTNKLLNFKIYLDTEENLRKFWKIKRDITHRKYNINQILDQINKRSNDFNKYIKPQSLNSDIIICFYTNKEFDYTDINQSPELYLKISIHKKYNMLEFLFIINKYNIDYKFYSSESNVILIFESVCSSFNDILDYFIQKNCKKNNFSSSKTTYYTIIQAIVLYIISI